MFHNSHSWANIFAQSIPFTGNPLFVWQLQNSVLPKGKLQKTVELRGLNMWAQLEHTPTDTKFKV